LVKVAKSWDNVALVLRYLRPEFFQEKWYSNGTHVQYIIALITRGELYYSNERFWVVDLQRELKRSLEEYLWLSREEPEELTEEELKCLSEWKER
jgi:hypothetical protein